MRCAETTSYDWRTFIIMQLLHDMTLLRNCAPSSLEKCYDLIADAVQSLRAMPVPEDATPGPYTKDHALRWIRHPLFKDHTAAALYQSIGELEQHITRVVALAPWKPNAPRPSLRLEDRLVFCYCDFNPDNFLFKTDAAGQLHLWMVDFEHASFLPLSFLPYGLMVAGTDRWFSAWPVMERIGHTLPTDNNEVLKVAAICLPRLR
ncbi:hypothetical protein VTK26DRAFT_913 [Humicola hyalothermophila]